MSKINYLHITCVYLFDAYYNMIIIEIVSFLVNSISNSILWDVCFILRASQYIGLFVKYKHSRSYPQEDGSKSVYGVILVVNYCLLWRLTGSIITSGKWHINQIVLNITITVIDKFFNLYFFFIKLHLLFVKDRCNTTNDILLSITEL